MTEHNGNIVVFGASSWAAALMTQNCAHSVAVRAGGLAKHQRLGVAIGQQPKPVSNEIDNGLRAFAT
jgi:hypothetical protein